MKSALITAFNNFQNILVLCPHCGEIHRLSELQLSYRGRPKRTWLDKLRDEEDGISQAEDRFEEQRVRIKEKAKEKGWKQVPRLIKKCVPTICAKGYFPQDLKAIFDPIDFIIFDGMNRKETVSSVVLMDGPAFNKKREKIQSSLKQVIKKGNYDWHTVKLDELGRIST